MQPTVPQKHDGDTITITITPWPTGPGLSSCNFSPNKILAVTTKDRLLEEPFDKLVALNNLDRLELESSGPLPFIDWRGDGDDEGPQGRVGGGHARHHGRGGGGRILEQI